MGGWVGGGRDGWVEGGMGWRCEVWVGGGMDIRGF